MSGLCAYSDILGKPFIGSRKYRIFGLALLDITMTIAASIHLAEWLDISLLNAILILTLAGIGAHRLFCVNTALNMKLFGIQSAT